MTLLVRRHEHPTVPVEIADTVEMFARESGRHATLHFIPTFSQNGEVITGTWMVRFTLKVDDPRLQLYRDGKVGEPPTEDVWLHVPDDTRRSGYRPLSLEDLGAGGVRTFLDKGNTWSGRGEYTSIEEHVRKAMAANEMMRQKNRAFQKEESRHEQKDKRRWRFKIPFLPVGIALKAAEPSVTSDPGQAATHEENVP